MCLCEREREERESLHDLSISDYKFWKTDQSQPLTSSMPCTNVPISKIVTKVLSYTVVLVK